MSDDHVRFTIVRRATDLLTLFVFSTTLLVPGYPYASLILVQSPDDFQRRRCHGLEMSSNSTAA